MTRIYVIVGETGEYDDHREWIAGYCKQLRKAKEIAEYYTRLAREIMAHTRLDPASPQYMEKYGDEFDKAAYAHPDKNFGIDYTGTLYYVQETKELK